MSFSIDKWIKYADQLDPYRRLSFTRETEKELRMPDKLLDDLDSEERELKANDKCFTALGDNNKEIGKWEMSKSDPSYQVDYSQCKCSESEKQQLKQLLECYPEAIAKHKYDIGKAKVDPIDIKTTTEKPVSSKFLRIPYQLRDEIRKHEQAMRNAGVMIRSDTPWVSSWVMVNKKDTTKRPCTDFRELNKVTITDPYPLPRIDGILEEIAGCHWYTALDLCNGYLQIPLTEEASRKCGVITEDGVYQMTRMPFGLKNAPGQFMRGNTWN